MAARPDRVHQPPTVGELLDQRPRDPEGRPRPRSPGRGRARGRRVPSPTTIVTRPTPAAARLARAWAARSAKRSIDTTWRASWARMAVWNPSPVPTSRTRSPPVSPSAATMAAIRLGWVVTCPRGIRIGSSR